MLRKRRLFLRRHGPIAERLESRCLLAANVQVLDAYFVDQTFNNPVPNPIIGTSVYLRTDFTTTGLASNASYTIDHLVQGVDYAYPINWGAGDSGTDTWEFILGPLSVLRGSNDSVTVTLDSQNTVAESNETDNATSFQFNPIQESLQNQLQQPLGAVAERNYGYVNYVDEDPTSPGYADYRGGDYTYDGHDAIDMSFPNFAPMDAGTPVVAAEAGTVVDMHDGEFDRNTDGGNEANYIEIDSGNGYQEYYYHLRDGSVGVQIGQTVTQGQVIGLMGSSGNAYGPHLHFAVYNGGPVETYQAPYVYWQNPVPYEGDVDFADDGGVTNYDPGNTNYDPSYFFFSEERPVDHLNIKQLPVAQNIYPWFDVFTPAGETESFITYRPNGTVFTTATFTTGENFGGANYVYNSLPAMADLGTWQVALVVNNVELARQSFVVSTTGSAEAQVAEGSTFIANGRTTPLDGGTYAMGATSAPLSFTVTNFGDAAMTLGTPTLPMGWTLTDPLATTLAPGASDTVGVKIDTSVAGYRYGFLSFTTNDPSQPTYSFALQGEVDPTTSTPAVTIYTRDSTASETGRQPGVIRVQRAGDTTNALTVNLSISGTAINGTDYTTVPTTVTIPAGASAASIIITPIDDAIAESTETAIVTLASGAGYSLGLQNSATVNIADNDTVVANTKISGQIYLDKNFNTYQDRGENGVGGITVFLDANSNGVWDAGEPHTTTDASGNYTFSSLAPGEYNVRIVPTNLASPSSYVNTTPVGAYLAVAGKTLTVNLGVFPILFGGTNGDDTYSVTAAPTSNRELITANGVTYNAIRSQIPSLTFDGSIGNDSLTLDASVLGLPPGLIVTTPISYAGDPGTDSVTIINTNASEDLTVNATQLNIASNTITLATVESIFLDAASNSTIALGNVTISSGTLSLIAGKNLILSVNTLTINGSGALNLGDNDMIVNAGTLGAWNGSNYTGILGMLRSGRGSGSWSGPGINSSSAGSSGRYAPGAAGASTILGISGNQTGVWEGQTVGAAAVLVKYTYAGDMNLDGKINGDDYFRIDSVFATHPTGYANGDLNYSGNVDADDYFIIDSNYVHGMIALSLPLYVPVSTSQAGEVAGAWARVASESGALAAIETMGDDAQPDDLI